MLTATKQPIIMVNGSMDNLVFVNQENPLQIDILGVDMESLNFASDNGSIYKRQDKYILVPVRNGDVTVTMRFAGKETYELHFKAVAVNSIVPAISLDTINLMYAFSGTHRKAFINDSFKLVTFYENSNRPAARNIEGFEMTVIYPDSTFGQSLVSESNLFTREQLEAIRKATFSSLIFIDKIKFRVDSSAYRYLSPMSIRLAN